MDNPSKTRPDRSLQPNQPLRPETPESTTPSARQPPRRAPPHPDHPLSPPQGTPYGRANEYSGPRTGIDDRRIPPHPQGAASSRANEYFVPREGIDREVITADIIRYLGNDASVRTGTIEDPETGERRDGYFITAYRNLTSAMIADLKTDSQRWEAERRRTIPRERSSTEQYLASTTHQSRQYYGPTAADTSAGPATGYPAHVPAGGQQQGGYGNETQYQQQYAQSTRQYYDPRDTAAGPAAGYPPQAPSGYQQPGVYGSEPQYQQGYAQPAQGYGNPTAAYSSHEWDAPRADTRVDPRADTVPRAAAPQYPSSTTNYGTHQDARSNYYSDQAPLSLPTQGYPSSADPYYDRAHDMAPTYSDAAPEAYEPIRADQTNSPTSAIDPRRDGRAERDRTDRERSMRERERRERERRERDRRSRR